MAAKKKTAKRRTGRPTKRDQRAEDTILTCLREGGSLNNAARCAGIGITTLKRWRAEDPAFGLACEKASGEACHRMARSIYERGIKGDTTASIWWQKTQDPDAREPKDQKRYVDVDLGLGEINSFADVSRAATRILDAVQRGDLDLDSADALNRLIQVVVAKDYEIVKATEQGGA